MAYIIQKQFIPGNDQIWVTKLTPNDEEFIFDTLSEVQSKIEELEAADQDGRKYRLISSL